MLGSIEIAIRIAILRFPETFGLKAEDVNPLLQFALIIAELEGADLKLDDILSDCVDNCENTIIDKIQQILSSNSHKPAGSDKLLSNHIKKALLKSGRKNGKPSKPESPPEESSDDDEETGSNGNGEAKKISVKQLRYIGYLYHQLGRKPIYKKISTLTQKQATMKIKDLEKEVSESE